jgi:hypothetical protein
MKRVMYNSDQKKAEKVFLLAVRKCCESMGFNPYKYEESNLSARVQCSIEKMSIFFTITSVEYDSKFNLFMCDLSVASCDTFFNKEQSNILKSCSFHVCGEFNSDIYCTDYEYMKKTWITPALVAVQQTIMGFCLFPAVDDSHNYMDYSWWKDMLKKCAEELGFSMIGEDVDSGSAYPMTVILINNIEVSIYLSSEVLRDESEIVTKLVPRIWSHRGGNAEIQIIDLGDHFCPLGYTVAAEPDEKSVKIFLVRLYGYISGAIMCASLYKDIKD